VHFGPQRETREPLSSFRYRQARYCWPWAWFSAPVLLISLYVLRIGLGDGALWMSMVFVMLLSGFALSMALVGGAALSLGARWAQLCETSAAFDTGWQRARFAISSLFLVPLWFWSCYWVFIAITQQHIIAGRPAKIVALTDNPTSFLISLTVHTSLLVLLPTHWMNEARKQFTRRKSYPTRRDPGLVIEASEQREPKRLSRTIPRLKASRKPNLDD